MECNLDSALLQDLLEGLIDPVEKIFVEEHLITCKKCRKELAELKLLFWDLNDKRNYDVNFPEELNQIKDALLMQFAEEPARKTTEIIIDINRHNVRAAGMFLDYVPGVRTGNERLKKGMQSAPSALRKVSKALIRSTRYLLAE